MIIRLKTNDKYEILMANRYGEPYWTKKHLYMAQRICRTKA